MTVNIPWHQALTVLVDRLRTDPRLSGVTVTSGAVDPESAGTQSIQFHSLDEETDWRQLGAGALEASATVTALIWVTAPGSGEDAIRAARRRADELRALVIEALWDDPTLGRNVQAAWVTGASYDQGLAGNGQRACRVTFQVRMTAWIRR